MVSELSRHVHSPDLSATYLSCNDGSRPNNRPFLPLYLTTFDWRGEVFGTALYLRLSWSSPQFHERMTMIWRTRISDTHTENAATGLLNNQAMYLLTILCRHLLGPLFFNPTLLEDLINKLV